MIEKEADDRVEPKGWGRGLPAAFGGLFPWGAMSLPQSASPSRAALGATEVGSPGRDSSAPHASSWVERKWRRMLGVSITGNYFCSCSACKVCTSRMRQPAPQGRYQQMPPMLDWPFLLFSCILHNFPQ